MYPCIRYICSRPMSATSFVYVAPKLAYNFRYVTKIVCQLWDYVYKWCSTHGSTTYVADTWVHALLVTHLIPHFREMLRGGVSERFGEIWSHRYTNSELHVFGVNEKFQNPIIWSSSFSHLIIIQMFFPHYAAETLLLKIHYFGSKLLFFQLFFEFLFILVSATKWSSWILGMQFHECNEIFQNPIFVFIN